MMRIWFNGQPKKDWTQNRYNLFLEVNTSLKRKYHAQQLHYDVNERDERKKRKKKGNIWQGTHLEAPRDHLRIFY